MSTKYAKDLPSGSKNRIQNIAVVGATGSVGQHITEHLVKSGKFTVTAITRAESKSTPPEGVKVAKVNYDDKSSLVEALTGQDALVITMAAGQGEASAKLIDAAAEAKVGWIMPNQYCPDVATNPKMGEESGLLPNVQGAVAQIEKVGVSAWVGLICSFWYPYSLITSQYAYGFDLKNKKVTFMDDGETKINTTTWEQCGRAVTNLFSLPILPNDEHDNGPYLEQWRNASCHVESFLVSQRDMLASVLRVTGDKESDWTIESEPVEQRWKDSLEYLKGSDRMRGFVQRMYSRVFFKDGSGDYSDKLDNEKLGLPKEDLDSATKVGLQMHDAGYNYFTR